MSRQTAFELLPGVWRRLDANGTLERFLGLWEDEIGYVADKIKQLADIQSPDITEDKFLPLLGKNVGHIWRDDQSFEWNRNRIKAAIRRYSYKGTTTSIEDLAVECGSKINFVQDNASKLLILGKQGRLGCDDAYLVSKDYWHDGAFLAQFSSTGDTETLTTELPGYIPAGQVWFVEFVHVSFAEFITDCTIELLGTLTFTNAQDGAIGFGILGQSLILSAQPSNDSDKSYLTSVWGDLFSKPIGSVGYGILGDNLFVSAQPGIASDRSYHEIGWHISVPSGALGHGILGSEIFLSVEPAFTPINELDDYIPTPVSLGPLVLEMAEGNIAITIDTYTQLTSLAFEMADVDLVICPSLQIDSTTLEATEANIAITHDPHTEVPSGELEMTAAEIEIDELVMGSIHYTLADIATLDEVNR